jgi:hypothetical protein
LFWIGLALLLSWFPVFLLGFAYIAGEQEYVGQPQPAHETLVWFVSGLWGVPGILLVVLGHFGWRRVPRP